MSEEKLYAVKNDKGVWLSLDSSHESVWYTNNPTFFKDRIYAEAQIIGRKAHVVELVEAPAKVVVSGKKSEILKKLDCEIRTKSTGYSPWKWLSKLDDLGMAVEDAYKALALGWEIRKETLYNVKVPLVQAQGGLWFYINSEEKLDATYLPALAKKFTMDEIERYGLQDCEKVECDNDDE